MHPEERKPSLLANWNKIAPHSLLNHFIYSAWRLKGRLHEICDLKRNDGRLKLFLLHKHVSKKKWKIKEKILN